MMKKESRTERRWLRSVIAASAEPLPEFPWVRGQRRRPAALRETEAETTMAPPPPRISLFGKGAVAAR
ncbi:MAG: hypothetical protein R3D63_00405 [Paracoccaceae bacterium]